MHMLLLGNSRKWFQCKTLVKADKNRRSLCFDLICFLLTTPPRPDSNEMPGGRCRQISYSTPATEPSETIMIVRTYGYAKPHVHRRNRRYRGIMSKELEAIMVIYNPQPTSLCRPLHRTDTERAWWADFSDWSGPPEKQARRWVRETRQNIYSSRDKHLFIRRI